MDSPAHLMNENELLDRLHNSDAAAFTEIYNLYWNKLFFSAAQKLQNLSEAEEVVQEIFLDVWKRRSELKISTGLSNYLSVCVKYKVINILAKRYQELRYQQHASAIQNTSDQSLENSLRFEELKQRLFKETSRLPEKCRMVFQLSRDKGYSQKQIAKELSISEKTVESHLYKALRTLRISLGQFITVLISMFSI